MTFTKYFTSFCVLLLALSASGSADKSSLRKRSPMLVHRQTCKDPSEVPLCPGFFACIPPGGICCQDSIFYAMPPDTCPDGHPPVATATVGATRPATTTSAPSIATSASTSYTYSITSAAYTYSTTSAAYTYSTTPVRYTTATSKSPAYATDTPYVSTTTAASVTVYTGGSMPLRPGVATIRDGCIWIIGLLTFLPGILVVVL